ncbi:hypothetical protein SUDANB95_06611 [Actinosynnema sp. ALI-1.44]
MSTRRVAVASFGGVLATHLVVAHLVAAHGPPAVGWYVAAAVLSVACVLLLPETYKARSRPTSVRL